MASPTEEIVETVRSSQGVELALYRHGGSGPALIICHATGFNALAYQPMLPALTASFQVFGFDFRGHGASTAPDDDDYSWSNMADDLLAVVDHLGGNPILTFGHSMGATTIMLAEKQRPNTITAAWMFEPIVFPNNLAPRNSQMAHRARKRRAVFESREQALTRYATRPPLGTWRADALAGYVTGGFRDLADGSVHLACHPETEAAVFEGAKTYTHEVNAFTPPVVIASGMSTEDPGPGDWAPSIAAALPNAAHAHYDDLTHFGPFQAPDVIARDAVSFLTNHTER